MDWPALAAIPDPQERLQRVHGLIEQQQEAMTELARLRREALQELLTSGMTQSDVARLLGITRARVSHLMAASGRKPERALLSAGDSVTIAVPVEDASYPDGSSRPVVHQEDTEFIERITRVAQSVGLKAEVEHIGPGDFIDLNRDGLIVTCGPRQSPWLEQALTADERYGFGRDEAGWYLEDKATGEQFRSPEDSGEPADLGYLGTLARPDGQGTWLYAAGIHAAGSRGAAEYLEKHLSELYREVKNVLWSCLVICRFDATTRDIVSAKLQAPLHRRGTAHRARRR